MRKASLTEERSKQEDGTIWNGAPAVLYYWINRSILTDKNAQDKPISKGQEEKSKKNKNVATNVLRGIGALFLSIVSSEMLLMIILGDSVEGSTALLLMFLVAIPFFALYFWLFTRHSKKKEESAIRMCPLDSFWHMLLQE